MAHSGDGDDEDDRGAENFFNNICNSKVLG